MSQQKTNSNKLIAIAVAMLLPSTTAFFSVRVAPPSILSMRVTGIESTPNPSSFKFDLDETFHSSTRGITYTAKSLTAGDVPSAPEPVKRVLELPGVESVYALGDWLCLNKVPSAKWDTIVSAAVDALGGPAESLDPLTLMMASGGIGDPGWTRSDMGGIAIRVQFSNGIPIQVEACPPGGPPLRRKLSSRFSDAMNEFVNLSGDEMAFFKGRQWLPRGVRYPEDDRAAAQSAEIALTAAASEIESAFPESRLRGAVTAAVSALRSGEGTSIAGSGATDGQREGAAAAAGVAVREAVAGLQSTVNGEVVAAVDTLCGLATSSAGGEFGAESSVAREALDALIGFAASGEGPVAARRAAVAFIGGAGDAAGSAGLDAVGAVFRGDKSHGVRRTAGDALSDLGNPGAVPIALAGLHDKSKLVRWRAARVVGELSCREQDAVELDEARERELEFEVGFELADAARKIRFRVQAAKGSGGDEERVAPVAGPVWKQIQERSNK